MIDERQFFSSPPLPPLEKHFLLYFETFRRTNNYKRRILAGLYNWVKTNLDTQVDQGEKFYVWDSSVHNWETDPIPEITGRSWQTLLMHATTKPSVRDTPSAIDVNAFDVVIYGTGHPDERDKDFWLCRTSCTTNLWAEKHIGSKTLEKERRITALGENFLKITFHCSFTERQVTPKELALYMRYAKTLHWVDEMATCTASNNDSAFIVNVPYTSEPRVLGVIPDNEWRV